MGGGLRAELAGERGAGLVVPPLFCFPPSVRVPGEGVMHVSFRAKEEEKLQPPGGAGGFSEVSSGGGGGDHSFFCDQWQWGSRCFDPFLHRPGPLAAFLPCFLFCPLHVLSGQQMSALNR